MNRRNGPDGVAAAAALGEAMRLAGEGGLRPGTEAPGC